MFLATAEQMRRLDRIAIEERGIPSIDLMEAAARGLAEVALSALPDKPRKCSATILCGTGNNGGDGIAAARLLHVAGLRVRVFLLGDYDKMTADAKTMAARLSEYGLSLEIYHPESFAMGNWLRASQVIIDAIFGVGLDRPITDPVRTTAIARINEAEGCVISADIPSGIDADSGRVLGCAVVADKTVTFTMPKPGHFGGKGGIHTGELTVWDIGLPTDLVKKEHFAAQTIDRETAGQLLPLRKPDGHKGDFGKVEIWAGSVGYTGAPVLAARAATRSGCGLVSLGVPASIYQIAAGKCMEEMPYPLPDTEGMLSERALQKITEKAAACDAVLLGPGLGGGQETAQLVRTLVETLPQPLVLDADGINALAGHIDSLDKRRGRVTILTPHDGEFARLTGEASDENRLTSARDFAKEHGCILVRKGHNTIVATPDGRVFLNTTGGSGLAKGGSGDVLAGVLVSLLAQGMEPGSAAALAVWLHGRAGDLAQAALTAYGMTPMDVIGRLPAAFRELTD
ncbi:MAG: NAD(P)H-hydrate dehydratase [Oscillospiraceae bacterium]